MHYRRKRKFVWIIVLIVIIVGFVWASNSDKLTSMRFTLGTLSIEDIMKHPENYEGKFVTLRGEFDTSLDGTYFLIDNNGFNFRFKPEIQRAFNIGQTYTIKGIIEKKTGFVPRVSGGGEYVVLYWYLKETDKQEKQDAEPVEKTPEQKAEEGILNCQEYGIVLYVTGEGVTCENKNTEHGEQLMEEGYIDLTPEIIESIKDCIKEGNEATIHSSSISCGN